MAKHKNMIILGIHDGHNASASIIKRRKADLFNSRRKVI